MGERGRVYSLVAKPGDKEGKAIPVHIDLVELVEGKTLTPEGIYVAGQDDKAVKHSARRGSWIAYKELKERGVVAAHSLVARSGVTFDFEGNTVNQISGPSAGLCFLVKTAQEIIEESLQLSQGKTPPCDFAATGILDTTKSDDTIRPVEAIEAKVKAALGVLRRGGAVFYPSTNAPLDDALHEAAAKKQIALVAVETPRQALGLILEKYKSSPGRKRPVTKRLVLWTVAAALVMIVGIALSRLFPATHLWLYRFTAPQAGDASRTSITHEAPSPMPACPVVEARLFSQGRYGEAGPLPEGRALTTGDLFRIRLEVMSSCYVYVFEVDSAHRIEWLFPSKRPSESLPNGVYWVPEDGVWLRLDNVRGEETVLVFATSRPAEFLENMREEIAGSKGLPTLDRRALTERILAEIKRADREGEGTLTRLTFQHE